MIYTTQGLMTASDLADMRDLYDLNPEPITLADLARELGATTDEVVALGNLDDWRVESLVDADDADAIREAWNMTEPYGVRDYIPSARWRS